MNLVRSKFVSSDLKIFEFDGDILGHSSEGEVDQERDFFDRFLEGRADGPRNVFAVLFRSRAAHALDAGSFAGDADDRDRNQDAHGDDEVFDARLSALPG